MKWGRESFILVGFPIFGLVSFSVLVLGLEFGNWSRGSGTALDQDGWPPHSGHAAGLRHSDQGTGAERSSSDAEQAAGGRGELAGIFSGRSSGVFGRPSARGGPEDRTQAGDSPEGDDLRPYAGGRGAGDTSVGGRLGRNSESRGAPRTVVIGSVTTSAGDPLGGVRIQIRESINLFDGSGRPLFGESPWRDLGQSSSNGTYELDTIPGMVYEIMAEAEGFAPGMVRIGAVATAPIVTLAPAATFQGAVQEREGGSPITQAHVRLRSAQYDKSGFTDSDGAFAFAGLVPGPALLELSHPSYKPASAVVSVVSGSATVQSYELEPGGLLLGRVRLADSAAIPPHLAVHLRNLQTTQLAGVTETGLLGEFTFESLVVGVGYRLTVFANDLGVHSLEFVSQATADGQEVEIVIEPLWDLSGTVTTPEGHPIPGASVILRSGAEGSEVSIPSGTTSVSGGFHFSGLGRAASYELVAFHPNHSVGLVSPISAETHALSDLFVVLPPGVRIYGRLTPEPQGPHVGNALLRLRVDPAQFLGRMTLYAFADDSGDFEFVPVPPSHCQLSVMAPGFRTLRDEFLAPSGEPELFREYMLTMNQNSGR